MFLKLVFCLVFFVAYFDPQNDLGLRYPLIKSIVPIYVYFFIINILDINKKHLVVLLSYVLPAWGLLVYFYRGDSKILYLTDTSYISFGIVFSIVNLLSTKKVYNLFKSSVIYVSVFFASFSFLTALYFFLNPFDNALLNFLIDNNIARISFREYGSIQLPYIYFYASTLLILPLSLLVEKKENDRTILDKFIFVAFVVSFFLSGTRSHIVLSIFFCVFFFNLHKARLRLLLAVLTVASLFLLNFNIIYNVIGNMFSLKEDTNSYKLSMIASYIRMFSDPLTIFFGQGFQAVEWNSDLKMIVTDDATKTELTFIEIFRVFGILPILPMFVLLSFKFKRLALHKRVALLALIFDGFLNPHIFSTYGALVMASIISEQN